MALKTSFEAGPALLRCALWTWSRPTGTRSAKHRGRAPRDVLTYPEYRDLAWNAPVGDLQQDVRHRVRLWATWDMTFIPDGSAASLSARSSPSTRVAVRRQRAPSVDYVTNPGYVTPPPTVTYWFTARDAYRTATVTSLDLALNWSLNVGRWSSSSSRGW